MKLRNLICLALILLGTNISAQKKSPAEEIFKTYLAKEEKTVAKIIVNYNDSLYSVFCQGILSDKQKEKRRLLTKFILSEPPMGTARAFYYRGVSFATSNKPDSALFDFGIAIRMDSAYINSYYSRGELYQTLNKHEKAIEDLSKVISMNGTISVAYHLRGLSYVSLKKYDLALADFNKAIELDPNADQSYMMRGIVYRETEDYLIAIENWKTAKKLKKENTQIADQLISDVKARIKESKIK